MVNKAHVPFAIAQTAQMTGARMQSMRNTMSAQTHRFAISPPPVLITVLVGVLIVCMLVAFHQVVSGAVQQAELRHKANALVIEASWRCNAAGAAVQVARQV